MNSIWAVVLTVLVSLCVAWGCSERRGPKTQGDESTTRSVAVQCSSSQLSTAPGEEEGRDVASIQYRQVYQLAYVPDNSDFTDQEVDYHIASSRADVSANRISLFIDGTTGRVPIGIDTYGVFTLPFSKEMLAENPKIVSNQPKGSLSLECVVSQKSIRLPESRAIPYRKLVEPELLSRTIETLVDGEKACPFPKTLWFRLERPESGNVVIHTLGTPTEIPISSDFFGIPLSSDLTAENPLVEFPVTSRRVNYVEGCGMPMARLSGRISSF